MSCSVRTLRDRYLRETGYTIESYTAPRFKIMIGKRAITINNPGMLAYHDLHHVVSGYKTGLIDEGRVSAYELRGGSHLAIIFLLCIGAITIGAFFSPGKVWKAWKSARGTSTLYASTIPYERLLDMDIGELRASLNIPAAGFEE